MLLLLLLLQDGWRSEEVGEGVVWKTRRFDDLYGAPQSVGVLDCDLATARLAFVPAEKGLERTSVIAARSRAVAAVNGGYYSKEGRPLGILKIDGLLLSPAAEGRGALGVDAAGALLFARLDGGDWPEARHALGGVPLLLENGVVPDMTRERAAHLVARHPRTAAGTTASGRALLVVVDGRSSRAAGMSCAELADFLKTLGCVWALNLDGGGSSTLWVRGAGVRNAPSDASGERPLANIVAVLAKDVVFADTDAARFDGEWTRVKGGVGEDYATGRGTARWRLKVEFAGDYEIFVSRPRGTSAGRWRVNGEAAEPQGEGWASLGRRRLEAGELELSVTDGAADAARLLEK